MTMLVIGLGFLGFGAAVWMLARASGPTRTVAQVLHDTEQTTRPGNK